MASNLTPREIAESEARIQDFRRRMESIPEGEPSTSQRALTPDEVAEIDRVNARAQDFIRALKEVPEAERRRPSSDRFIGPIGLPLELNPDPGPEPESEVSTKTEEQD